MRFLLSGPPDTPYSRGLFIFDCYCGKDYPNVSPEFHLITTNNLTLNPNLYQDGKICLSILNTYSGSEPDKSEKWIPKISTLSQVLISIQSQIFIDYPYFNDGESENERGTEYGTSSARNYNERIYYNTMNAAILNILNSCDMFPSFKDAIITHFYLQKEKIIEQCQTWIDQTENNDIQNNMIKCFKNIKQKLSKLSLP
jgi:baculoviral IAP repeat-containing protein 6